MQMGHTYTQNKETCNCTCTVRTGKRDIHVYTQNMETCVIVHVRTGKRDIKHNTE